MGGEGVLRRSVPLSLMRMLDGDPQVSPRVHFRSSSGRYLSVGSFVCLPRPGGFHLHICRAEHNRVGLRSARGTYAAGQTGFRV